ncbi:TPA: oligosaccharide flippase family protein, partial [Yersinia enterocolitica]
MSIKILSIGLRLFTLFIKFVFILFLAKYFTPEDVGRFGYVTAAIGYLIYFVGFEFYTYSCRELIKEKREAIFSIIANQLTFYFLVYTVVLPAIIVYLSYKSFSAHFIFLFCAITCLEHLAQEVNRILITLRKNLLASVVLFIRGAAWCILVIMIVIIDPKISDFITILYFWLSGCFIALCLSVYHLLGFYSKVEVCSDWIKRGVISALPLFLATLAFRGINTFDRFIIGYISNLGVAGAYIIYSSIGNAIISAIDAAIVSFLYPHVLLAAHERNYENYKLVMRKLYIGLTLITIMCICGITLVIPFL